MAGVTKRSGGLAPSWQKKLESAGGRVLKENEKRGMTDAAVILAIDCSSSMSGNKIGQARAGALAFAHDALKRGYAVGVVQFDSDATVRAEPSRAVSPLRAAIEALAVSGSTNLSAGIDLAASQIGERPNSVICIVTDGAPDDAGNAIESAARAKSRAIDIMAVGTDDADWDFLSRVVTRSELATKVERQRLGQQIADMSKKLPLLPGKP